MADRKAYQHQQYLKRKFKGLSKEQVRLAQLKEDQVRSQRAVKRHKFWLRMENEVQPGLYVIFTNMAAAKRELICERYRREAAMLETEAKLGLFVENPYIYSRGKRNVDN